MIWVFPSKFKISKTVAIHKLDSKTDPHNYRGISLINNFSKVFEKILSDNIYDFLESENFFYKNQFDFRKGMSCNHAILKLIIESYYNLFSIKKVFKRCY